MVGSLSACCERAASGHAMVDAATTLMKSRRRIAFPVLGTTLTTFRLQQGFAASGMGFRDQLHGSNLGPPMSALGH
jgi:hypothetical protein